MRISTISSTIASVVSRVIASIVTGSAAVAFLRHLMRERMGYWQERCQPGYAFDGDTLHQLHNPKPGNKPGLLRLLGISTLAVCPSPMTVSTVRLTSVRTTGNS